MSFPSRNKSHKLFKIIKKISSIFFISSSNNPSKSKRITKKITSTNCYLSTLSLYECNCQYHENERKKVQKRQNIFFQEKLEYGKKYWRNCDDEEEEDEATFEERQSLEQRAEEFIKRFYEDQSLQRQNLE